MPNRRYTISIPSRESELIEFVDRKIENGSFSSYIRELIRKDIEHGRSDDFEKIYQYVENRLRESGWVIRNNEDQPNNIIGGIDKEIILDLF